MDILEFRFSRLLHPNIISEFFNSKWRIRNIADRDGKKKQIWYQDTKLQIYDKRKSKKGWNCRLKDCKLTELKSISKVKNLSLFQSEIAVQSNLRWKHIIYIYDIRFQNSTRYIESAILNSEILISHLRDLKSLRIPSFI